MIRRPHRAIGFALAAFVAASCGPGVVVTTAGPGELRAALSAPPEELEATPVSDRALLYDQLGRQAAEEASRGERDAPVLFPVAVDHAIVPAPFAPDLDLLDIPPGAPAVQIDVGPDGWPEETQAGLSGASERELAARVAGTLLAHWHATGPVVVVRTPSVPYAAAFVDGKLRLNPALVYLAVAHVKVAASVERAALTLAAPQPIAEVVRPQANALHPVAAPAAPMEVEGASPPPTAVAPASPLDFPGASAGTAAVLLGAGLLGLGLLRRR